MTTPSTTSADNAESFLSGKLAHVDVARIEHELRELWKQAAEGDEKSSGASVVRACSFNLVLYTQSDEAEKVCDDILDRVASQAPCRAILAIHRPEKPHDLEAWVSARCHVLGSSKQICSEQITVRSDGGKPQELTSVITPLILSDLPVVVWWRHPTIDDAVFNDLHGRMRRLIVDSHLAPFDTQMLQDTAKVLAGLNIRKSVADLNWRRISGWCRSLADAFDGFPLHPDRLNDIAMVEVEFASNDEGLVSNQCVLLASWLASRLQWEPVSAKLARWEFKSPQGKVTVEFKATHKTHTDGHIYGVTLHDGTACILQAGFEQTEDSSLVVVRCEQDSDQEITRTDHNLDEAVLVGQELERMVPDPIFDETVRMASRILKLAGTK